MCKNLSVYLELAVSKIQATKKKTHTAPNLRALTMYIIGIMLSFTKCIKYLDEPQSRQSCLILLLFFSVFLCGSNLPSISGGLFLARRELHFL